MDASTTDLLGRDSGSDEVVEAKNIDLSGDEARRLTRRYPRR
jgi:hypothetical protein